MDGMAAAGIMAIAAHTATAAGTDIVAATVVHIEVELLREPLMVADTAAALVDM